MPRIDLDGDSEGGGADGVTALVVAVVELLVETMEREGLRRMESGQLTDEEVERLGERFAALDAEIEALKETAGVEDEVEDLRADLDGLVSEAVHSLDVDGAEAARAPRGVERE